MNNMSFFRYLKRTLVGHHAARKANAEKKLILLKSRPSPSVTPVTSRKPRSHVLEFRVQVPSKNFVAVQGLSTPVDAVSHRSHIPYPLFESYFHDLKWMPVCPWYCSKCCLGLMTVEGTFQIAPHKLHPWQYK